MGGVRLPSPLWLTVLPLLCVWLGGIRLPPFLAPPLWLTVLPLLVRVGSAVGGWCLFLFWLAAPH